MLTQSGASGYLFITLDNRRNKTEEIGNVPASFDLPALTAISPSQHAAPATGPSPTCSESGGPAPPVAHDSEYVASFSTSGMSERPPKKSKSDNLSVP
jgi:hypothetical protein